MTTDLCTSSIKTSSIEDIEQAALTLATCLKTSSLLQQQPNKELQEAANSKTSPPSNNNNKINIENCENNNSNNSNNSNNTRTTTMPATAVASGGVLSNDQMRHKFFQKIGITAPTSPRSVVTTPPQQQKQQQQLAAHHASWLPPITPPTTTIATSDAGTPPPPLPALTSSSPASPSTTTKPLIYTHQQALKSRPPCHDNDEDGNPASSTYDSPKRQRRCQDPTNIPSNVANQAGSATTTTKASRGGSLLKFEETVQIIPIPMRHEYSHRVRTRLWSGALEIHQNAARNTMEFASEGWDWRSVIEDDRMYVCSTTGELIHPCHYEPGFQAEPPVPDYAPEY
mmetsp:Transcript_1228/g.2678  ORF Transcript_1228/g.2678 Transcript_1228/m.2678 type:complete len:341 (-) Transcript_1228:539-1561(-)